MARGKYRAAQAARERGEIAKLAAQLAEDVAAERERLQRADEGARQTRHARGRLNSERRELTRQVAEEARQLQRVVNGLTGLVEDLESSRIEVRDAWHRCAEKLSHRLGGEAAVRSLLRGIPTIVLPEGGHRKTSNEVARARAAARGKTLPGATDFYFDPITWYAPWLPEPLRSLGRAMREYEPIGVIGRHTGRDIDRRREVPEHLHEAARFYADHLEYVSASTVYDPHPLALAAWHTPPWLAPGAVEDLDLHRIAPALGIVEDVPDAALDEQQDRAGPAEDSKQQWRRELGVITETGRLTAPWSARPVFVRPADAVALRYWYRAAAVAGWRHGVDTLALVNGAAEGDWKRQTLPLARAIAHKWEVVGRASLGAAIFWLPAGQTAAHADSEPLDPPQASS